MAVVDHTPEQWRDVPGYEGRYQVSDLGRVRSLVGRSCRDLKLSMCGRYLGVALGRGNNAYVHQLVLFAFRGPRPPGQEACHENDVKTDNSLTNLRWDTPKANKADAKRNGRTVRGESHGQARLTADIVDDVRARATAGESVARIARGLGVSRQTLHNAISGKSWAHVPGFGTNTGDVVGATGDPA